MCESNEQDHREMTGPLPPYQYLGLMANPLSSNYDTKKRDNCGVDAISNMFQVSSHIPSKAPSVTRAMSVCIARVCEVLLVNATISPSPVPYSAQQVASNFEHTLDA